jgi:H+/Cl- antiporter ClcA
MDRLAIPMQQTNERRITSERRNARPRRSNYDGERVVEAYFAVMILVIVGMIIGLAAYTVLRVIPEWEKSHSSRNRMYQYYNPPFDPARPSN